VTADQLDDALKPAQDAGWSHLEFLHRLLADQAGPRRQRRIERLIKEARFREALPLSTIDWNFNPAIPRLKIEALAQADFIRRKQNVVFVGQSCLGKSTLIQSIGLAATNRLGPPPSQAHSAADRSVTRFSPRLRYYAVVRRLDPHRFPLR
jgi:DNA replication protein DnaC